MYDKFDCSAVAFTQPSDSVNITVQTEAGAATFVCSQPYSAASGGACTVEVPDSLFTTGQSATASLRIIVWQQGAVSAETSTSATLVGAPDVDPPEPRSAFAYGPNRFLYPGEVFAVPIFANTNGEEADMFVVHVQFDNSVLQFVDDFQMGAGWDVRFACT